MNVLDLFSGIGGFSLGLERAGMRTVAFCEVDPYCRAVLAKHWPDVPCYGDIRELTADRLATDGIHVDLICGGFPCQDISVAGKGAGLAGARSGLWSEYARLIGEVRPRYVIVENVSALLARGLSEVLGELASLGFDAEWHCIPATYVGAPHRRDRIWIVACPSRDELRNEPRRSGGKDWPDSAEPRDNSPAESVADSECAERGPHASSRRRMAERSALSPGEEGPGRFGGRRENVADATEQYGTVDGQSPSQSGRGGEIVADADREGELQQGGAEREERGWPRNGREMGNAEYGRREGGHPDGRGTDPVMSSGWWESEPDVGRVAHGVSSRVDRLKSLGNAVVPQIPEIIGRAIMRTSDQLAGSLE